MSTTEIEHSTITGQRLLDDPTRGCWVDYYPGFIPGEYCPSIYEQLDVLPMEHNPPSANGSMHRDIGFFIRSPTVSGRSSGALPSTPVVSGYTYAGQTSKATNLDDHPILTYLLDMVNNTLGADFNGILLNRYDPGDFVGWHADTEKGLDTATHGVVSLSFGATRDFKVKKIHKSVGVDIPDMISVPLQQGDMLIMGGTLQKHYKHSVPARKRCGGTRISVTLRRHIS